MQYANVLIIFNSLIESKIFQLAGHISPRVDRKIFEKSITFNKGTLYVRLAIVESETFNGVSTKQIGGRGTFLNIYLKSSAGY